MFLQIAQAVSIAGLALVLNGSLNPSARSTERLAGASQLSQQGPAGAQQGTASSDAVPKAPPAFQQQLDAYMAIHKKAEGSLPRLPTEATPEQIDRNQRDLGRLIQEARHGARQGDVFVPEMQTLVRGALKALLTGAEGGELKASIMDENPMDIKITVNGRYPDAIPLSTMPPQILQALPKMPEELEYRFVGPHLVILDSPAHIIVDFIPNVLS
jgi:hypothetical protein